LQRLGLAVDGLPTVLPLACHSELGQRAERGARSRGISSLWKSWRAGARDSSLARRWLGMTLIAIPRKQTWRVAATFHGPELSGKGNRQV
ncbi:MAG: hypothetical protein U9Q70_03880, partial [Chloroflexota bacterium]|nr:hypothetical protein [Chloroflexota bacterium]